MADTFYAEMITRSKVENTSSRLEITLADNAGALRTISLGPEVIAALGALANARATPSTALTKLPKRYAVGHGRHEPVVMLRFEDEPAYGLSATLAADLAEALLEEVETVSDTKYCLRQ
ncbi:hypothetical protein [Hyphomicrobium sp.]|jgi:hypothetical protein|uniref:hypothetical protein n=1 Tax=Hyphomicrobium sp. TaxID=82 RepID=UPI002CC46D05|nr:hypothetical protein [Hyphomicrobium sp.]HVZ04545.1 hypothetical protein [Hyphomicrobium sp.]